MIVVKASGYVVQVDEESAGCIANVMSDNCTAFGDSPAETGWQPADTAQLSTASIAYDSTAEATA
jgi:hypothetical protein